MDQETTRKPIRIHELGLWNNAGGCIHWPALRRSRTDLVFTRSDLILFTAICID